MSTYTGATNFQKQSGFFWPTLYNTQFESISLCYCRSVKCRGQCDCGDSVHINCVQVINCTSKNCCQQLYDVHVLGLAACSDTSQNGPLYQFSYNKKQTQ